MKAFFRKFSHATSLGAGTPAAFITAMLTIVLWGITGPMFHYSDTWQLVINTSTTIITFLMVFLIQNTQNRDSKAIHLKLDEIIRSIKEASNDFIDLEDCTDMEIDFLQKEFVKLKNETLSKKNERKTYS